MPKRFKSSFCHWPISDFGHDQQDALRTLRAALGDNQAGLNRLSQADLVRKNATAFAQTSERKDHRVDLVRVGINARLPLRCGIALPVVRPANPDEVLREDPLVEGVHHIDVW